MQVANENNKCFTVWSNEIEGRIDAYYYSSKFDKVKKLQNKKTIKFGDLIEIITKGETPLWRGDVYSTSGIPFLKVQNISEEGIKGDLFYISDKIHDRMKRSQLNGGELLYTMAGRIGTATILPDNFGKANINQAIAKIILKKGINRDYIKCLLNSDFCKLQAERFLTTSAQPNINFDQIKDIKIPLLSPETQNKIVEIMQSAYDKKADKEQKTENILNSIDDYILGELEIKIPEIEDKKCFCVSSGDMVNNRFDSYYYQPRFRAIKKAIKAGKYKIVKLKDILADIKKGVEVGSDAYISEGIPFVRVSDIDDFNISMDTDKKISLELYQELKNDYKPKINELLYSKDGSIGFCAVVKENKDFIVSGGVLRLKVKKENNNYYIKTILSSKIFKTLADHKSIGAIIKHLLPEELLSFEMPLPPLESQEKITKEIKERMAQAEKMKTEAKNEIEKAKQEVEKIILQ